MNKFYLQVVIGASCVACAMPVAAQSTAKATTDTPYPTRPIRIVVPFPPGASPNDITARLLGRELSQSLQQQVVIDNRPGAAGNIGAEIVAKSTPDGYTLLVSSTTLTIAPNAYKNLTYDPGRDLLPVTMVASAPMMVMVNTNVVPAGNIKELIAYAKSRPGQIKFSSGGNGTVPHLSGEMLNAMAGIRMEHIPYKGGAPATVALLGGEVGIYIDTPTGSMQTIKQARIKVLAVTEKKRSSLLPDVPTLDEAGVPGFELRVWYGVFAPAKTPRSVVQRLHTEIVKALQSPEVKARFTGMGTETLGVGPDEFSRVYLADLQKWSKFIRDTGLKLD